MQYWWVNQNQTYKAEVSGGFLWSPKTRKDGGRNQFYVNMTLVQPGDVVFSFCDTLIKAVGIVTGIIIGTTICLVIIITNFMAVIIANDIAIIVAGGVAVGITVGAAVGIGVSTAGFVEGFIAGGVIGFITGFMVNFISDVVGNAIESSLETGQPYLIAQLSFLILIMIPISLIGMATNNLVFNL